MPPTAITPFDCLADFFPPVVFISNYIPNIWSEYLMLLNYIFSFPQKKNYSPPSAVQGVGVINSIPFQDLQEQAAESM